VRRWLDRFIIQGAVQPCVVCGGPEPIARGWGRFGTVHELVASDDERVKRVLCDQCYRSETDRLPLRRALQGGPEL
jgi:hypothetical protein